MYVPPGDVGVLKQLKFLAFIYLQKYYLLYYHVFLRPSTDCPIGLLEGILRT